MIFGCKASVFYTFNAICALIVVFTLRYALRVILLQIIESSATFNINTHKPHLHSTPQYVKILYIVDIVLIMLLLSPTFITSWLRLFVPERMEFVFLSVFLFCYSYVLGSHSTFRTILALIGGILCANIALYYKETAFALIFAFGFVHLCAAYLAKQNLKWQVRVFGYALIFGAIVWFIIYVVVVLARKSGDGFYGSQPYNAILLSLKAGFTYILSEPFLFIIIFIALIVRIYAIFVRKLQPIPLLDASICGSAILLLEYIVLRLVSYHYPLPAYIFGLIVIATAFLLWWQHKWGKVLLGLCALLFVGNSLLTSVYLFAHYKFVPANFQSTLHFLSDYIKTHSQTRIFLDDVDRVANGEVYHSFGKWLLFYGANDFDLLSSLEVDERFLDTPARENAQWSVFKDNQSVEIQSGDIVIITTFRNSAFDLDKMLKNGNYELLFSADSGYNVPLLGIKSLLKGLALSLGLKQSDAILSQNIYALPLHFYVLRVY